MTQIRYIGLKPVKEDNVAGTGLIWRGQGDVHEVADPVAAGRLLSYPSVWDEVAATQPAVDAEAGKSALEQVVELDALREKAKSLGVDVKGTWGAKRLTQAITDAEAGKSA